MGGREIEQKIERERGGGRLLRPIVMSHPRVILMDSSAQLCVCLLSPPLAGVFQAVRAFLVGSLCTVTLFSTVRSDSIVS